MPPIALPLPRQEHDGGACLRKNLVKKQHPLGEFLTEELIPEEGEVKRSPKKEPSGKLQVLKPGAIDIISRIRPNEAQQHVTLPSPKSGAPPLDVRISSEVATDLFLKKESNKVGRSSKRDSEHKGCLHANHYDGLF